MNPKLENDYPIAEGFVLKVSEKKPNISKLTLRGLTDKSRPDWPKLANWFSSLVNKYLADRGIRHGIGVANWSGSDPGFYVCVGDDYLSISEQILNAIEYIESTLHDSEFFKRNFSNGIPKGVEVMPLPEGDFEVAVSRICESMLRLIQPMLIDRSQLSFNFNGCKLDAIIEAYYTVTPDAEVCLLKSATYDTDKSHDRLPAVMLHTKTKVIINETLLSFCQKAGINLENESDVRKLDGLAVNPSGKPNSRGTILFRDIVRRIKDGKEGFLNMSSVSKSAKEALEREPENHLLIPVSFGKDKNGSVYEYAASSLFISIGRENESVLGYNYETVRNKTILTAQQRFDLLRLWVKTALDRLPEGISIFPRDVWQRLHSTQLGDSPDSSSTLVQFGKGEAGLSHYKAPFNRCLSAYRSRGVFGKFPFHFDHCRIGILYVNDENMTEDKTQKIESLTNALIEEGRNAGIPFVLGDALKVVPNAQTLKRFGSLHPQFLNHHHFVIVVLPGNADSDRSKELKGEWSSYTIIKNAVHSTRSLDKKNASFVHVCQVLYEDTLSSVDLKNILTEIRFQVLRKMGCVPFVLANAMPADATVGMDVGRHQLSRKSGSRNAPAAVALCDARGFPLGFLTTVTSSEGEEIPDGFLRDIVESISIAVLERRIVSQRRSEMRILVLRDGRLLDSEVLALRQIEKERGLDLILVEVTKRAPRFYLQTQGKITKPKPMTAVFLSESRALCVTTSPSEKIGFPRPLSVKVKWRDEQQRLEVRLKEVARAVCQLTALNFASMKASREPSVINSADKLADKQLRNIIPNLPFDTIQEFWL